MNVLVNQGQRAGTHGFFILMVAGLGSRWQDQVLDEDGTINSGLQEELMHYRFVKRRDRARANGTFEYKQ